VYEINAHRGGDVRLSLSLSLSLYMRAIIAKLLNGFRLNLVLGIYKTCCQAITVLIGISKVNGKLSLCLTKNHVMKTYGGSGGIAPRILYLDTRWR